MALFYKFKFPRSTVMTNLVLNSGEARNLVLFEKIFLSFYFKCNKQKIKTNLLHALNHLKWFS